MGLTTTAPRRDAIVYKMHGDLRRSPLRVGAATPCSSKTLVDVIRKT
jgi:hypothetical protein